VKNIVIKYAFLQDMLIPYSSQNGFIYLIVDKFSSTGHILGAKTPKKCCLIGFLEIVVCWPLVFSVKDKWTNFVFHQSNC
jgi:hypothetical protein